MESFNEDKAAAKIAELVALECGVHHCVAKQIHTAAILHDVGKSKIPDSIIGKPGKLTDREFEIMKTHTRLGAEMLKSIQGNVGKMARLTALYHHERYDGGGYWGKYFDELPVYVPIVSISDVFVALVCERPYKSAWPPNDALEYIGSQAGAHFPPALVRTFLPLARDDARIAALFDGR